jgi:hypothetical protein
MTVVIPRPPERVRARWRLPHGDPSRIIVMPGRDPAAIMACIDELVAARRADTGPHQLTAANAVRTG